MSNMEKSPTIKDMRLYLAYMTRLILKEDFVYPNTTFEDFKEEIGVNDKEEISARGYQEPYIMNSKKKKLRYFLEC